MATKYSLEKAAQAWCKKSTKHIEMDTVLAKAFAEIIDEVIKEKNTSGPEQAAKDLLLGFNKGLSGDKLLKFARRSLSK